MADVQHTFETFKHLRRRAILPLIAHPDPSLRESRDPSTLPDLKNVQGDVVYLFPKNAEDFIFFRINNVGSFKNALKDFNPTSSEDVKELLLQINDAKERAKQSSDDVKPVEVALRQIAFTRMGLNYLGIKEQTRDSRFDYRCMRDDKTTLGDQGKWDDIFEKSHYDPVNGSVKDDAGALHGVITICGNSEETCTQGTEDILKTFGDSIQVAGGVPVRGRARKDKNKGHEHFGFKDGISQPAPRGVVAPHKGQIEVDPGVLIMGYPGDPVLEDPTIKVKRPDWTKDGTMLVFRKLEQDVLLFEDFVNKNGPRWREFIPPGDHGSDLTDQEGCDLFGARLIGRWKSGAPLARCPYRDSQKVADDDEQNNDFDYSVPGTNEPSNLYCPFTIHTRKTAPRNLDPYVSRKYLEAGSIVRGGLPYGDDVTAAERTDFKNNPGSYKQLPRGLLFNCYASSLDQGFVRQTTGYAGNDYFPITSLVPTKHGQDPILGSNPPKGSAGEQRRAILENSYTYATGEQVDILLQDKTGEYEVSGFVKVKKAGLKPPPGADNPFFVTSRGGEYFFVPSISTLTQWANDPIVEGSSGLDILFLLDATSSMQVYIDQVRNNVQKMCDTLAASGKWPTGNPRFGFITFRDHPYPLDNSVRVTVQYPFESDVDAIKSSLSKVVAKDGGDGPEAQSDALDAALKVKWKKDATQIVILITDSPPHGLGEVDDDYPDGCPCKKDPVVSANQMASQGATLHVLSCEPTLSSEYASPLDFYRGITLKTGGKLFPLSDASSLTDLILGSVFESHDIEKLATQHEQNIHSQAQQGGHADTISQNLFDQLSREGVRINTLDLEDIYEPNSDGDKNAEVWFNAKAVDDFTKGQLKYVTGFRLKSKYRDGGKTSITSQEKVINQEQVKRVVVKCLAKKM